jgi:hypothetical protein
MMPEDDVLHPPRDGKCARCGRQIPDPPDGGWVWTGQELICPDCWSDDDEKETVLGRIELVKEDDC